jgi:uncharacterized membrane protein YfcA
MEITHILGYAGAVLTGFILGLLGGGGALLAIPVLVYLFKIEPSVATGYSLFLIAITASSGAVQNIRKKLIDYNAALYYGVPSVITVFIVRSFIMPAIPKIIFQSGSFTLSKNHFILILLSIVMFAASYRMITAKKNAGGEVKQREVHHLLLAFYAVLIGLFMGIVGTGGGFLMVPALIYFANVPPKKAVGTSLLLVSVNSFVGFAGDLRSHNAFDWQFLITFSAFSVAGVFLGHYVTEKIHNDKLQKYFGFFILVMALFIIIKEGFLKI